MPSSSSGLETRILLGRNASDIYGRTLGRVIGVERNHYGELDGIQLESIGGTVVAVKTRGIALTPNSITITPDWKMDAEEVSGEVVTLKKRIIALEKLRESGDIDREVHEELLETQRSAYLERVKFAEALTVRLRGRRDDLAQQVSSLTKHLVNAKLEYHSGELDEASLKLARESIEPSLKPLISEKNDVISTIGALEKILPREPAFGR